MFYPCYVYYRSKMFDYIVLEKPYVDPIKSQEILEHNLGKQGSMVSQNVFSAFTLLKKDVQRTAAP